ncbi:hypothetical protein LTS18_003214 [Coniosporium uncinatum]|uniref:Uncharacterized protein n=1 Tax=Coniosporium uncinatum TaxID=93489 RepID=A0ACC3DY04_9PEZI|nr:hypothetical protein LTS18_003214 [Coniosporium uncinatum]
MTTVLKDDTKTHTVGAYGPALARELARISLHHRINRHNSYEWARDLSFLIYDDEGAEGHDEYGSDDDAEVGGGTYADGFDESEAVQIAIANSLLQNDRSRTPADAQVNEQLRDIARSQSPQPERGVHVQEGLLSDGPRSEDSEDDGAMLDYAIALSLQEEDEGETTDIHDKPSCRNCEKYPKFPGRGRAKQFRVVRFSAEAFEAKGGLCDHYIAISYYWQSDASGKVHKDKEKGSYRVRVVEADGNVIERRNRAPDETIERAVEMA